MLRVGATLLFFNPLNVATTQGFTSLESRIAHQGLDDLGGCSADAGGPSLAPSAYVCMNHSVAHCAPFHLDEHHIRSGHDVYRNYQRKANVNRNLYQFVLEYDHQQRMGHAFAPGCCESHFFSRRPFSGSAIAAVTTTLGVLLFALTYGYNIAKPVVDAHYELWKPAAEQREEEAAEADNGKSPKEEEDDDE
ncbi:hypothetical protein STCU_12001 [Strigomonas culicis]|uniref:Uncharacterized protein n=1 Tax=Strigomonas culicis TaxID=28005 RepID=S9TBS7_9TRYP|nr:hypothetical protein STCU_12001 [Strigomonas culicis]|eukprot:EPY15472.1 hypothetical protein STCU_12001 [Strigomonas culicis]